MKIVISFCVLLSQLISANWAQETGRYLNYENYKDDRIYLPFDFPPVNNLVIEDSTILPVSSHMDIRNKIQLESHIFNFLIMNWVINHLNKSFYFKNYTVIYNIQDYLISEKQTIKLYYLGKIRISDSFESHLILSVENINDPIISESTSRYVFLLNEKNSRIQSIVEVSSYFVSPSEISHRFTRISPEGSFNVMDKLLSSDVIVSDETGNELLEMYDERFWINFYFDNQGFLVKAQH